MRSRKSGTRLRCTSGKASGISTALKRKPTKEEEADVPSAEEKLGALAGGGAAEGRDEDISLRLRRREFVVRLGEDGSLPSARSTHKRACT
jgi:hypothetical protein